MARQAHGNARATGFTRLSTGLPTPIRGQYAFSNETMERRMRPVAYAGHMAVLHGVEMNVIVAIAQVALVANRMFPISPLRNTALALRQTATGAAFIAGNLARKIRLDAVPTARDIRIAFGKRPDAAQVLRQNHARHHRIGPLGARRAECAPERIDPLHQQSTPALQQIHGEEVGPSRHPQTSIIRHADSMPPPPRAPAVGKLRAPP
jgi:hypothetical protein